MNASPVNRSRVELPWTGHESRVDYTIWAQRPSAAHSMLKHRNDMNQHELESKAAATHLDHRVRLVVKEPATIGHDRHEDVETAVGPADGGAAPGYFSHANHETGKLQIPLTMTTHPKGGELRVPRPRPAGCT